MEFNSYFSFRKRQQSRDTRDTQDIEDESIKSYLPILASPINRDARDALSSHTLDPEKMTIAPSGAASLATTMLAGNGRTSSGNIVIYKPHHEATSIELFYDLFFVANLGTLDPNTLRQHAYSVQRTSQQCINIPMQNVILTLPCTQMY